jgi:hypothetical protein
MLRRPNLFVELINGSAPVPLTGQLVFGHDKPYLGIGTNMTRLRAAQAKAHSMGHDASFVIVPDITQTGLTDNMASEIFLADYITRSSSEARREKVEKVLAMSRNILAHNAELIVLETKRPPSPELVQELIENAGFSLQTLVTSNDPNWIQEAGKYNERAAKRTAGSSKLASLAIAKNKKL